MRRGLDRGHQGPPLDHPRPRTAADAAQMESAAFLLPHLDKRLPFAVPVEAGSVPLRDSGRAMVYPHLEGRNLDFARLPAGPGIAAALGRALAHIHNLDPLLYDESGVPTYDADACRSRHLVELDRVGASGHIPSALMSRWERALENVACWRFASVPLHGRLSGELVVADFAAESDSATGRIVAVTGWDQARVADPAEDFAQLWGRLPRRPSTPSSRPTPQPGRSDPTEPWRCGPSCSPSCGWCAS